MYDKSKLGTRYICFQCGTKFYDLNRPEPTCPECGADQTQAPTRSWRDMLAGGRSEFSDDDVSASFDDDDDASDDDDDFDDIGVDDDEDAEEEESGDDDE